MKTLIIYAHPDTGGHCPLILENITAKLDKMKKDYEVIDLYKIKYDPVLHENEHYTRGNREVDKVNLGFQKKITDTNKLIFIYPMWWNSTPAILKGFIDRVMTGRFAFTYKGKLPVGLLKGKKAAVFVTSGAPKWAAKWLMGYRCIKVVVRDTLGFCGVKAKAFHIDSANKLTDGQKVKIEKQVKKGLRFLMK